MKRYILIETGDGGEEDRRAYATEAERDRATLEAIWFGGPSEDDKREAECYLSELRKKGVVWFEGDPPLRWETLPDAPASPSTTGSREKAMPEKVWLNPHEFFEDDDETAIAFLAHPQQGELLWQSGIRTYYSESALSQARADCRHPGCCCVCGHQGKCPECGPTAGISEAICD